MSRRRSSSNAHGTPPDREVAMGPPTVPAPLSGGHTAQSPPDAGEKYKKLKRRFFELEEETRSELHRSGERNVRMREERDNLLERMLDLEKTGVAQSSNGSPTLSSTTPSVPMAQLSSSSYPRTLRNPKARTSFVANLREAAAEDDADDDLDPLLTSRHLGPQARRRDEEERRDRGDEEGWEPRNGGHRRGSLSGDAASISSADYNQPSSSTSIRGLALQSPPTNHSHPPMHSPHQRRSLTPDQHNGNGYKPDSSVAGDNDVDMDEGGSGYDNLSGPQGYTQRSSGTPNRRDLHELGYVEGQADGRGSPAFSVRSEAASTASNTGMQVSSPRRSARQTRSSREIDASHDSKGPSRRSTRTTRSEGSAIAAVVAAAAEAEAAEAEADLAAALATRAQHSPEPPLDGTPDAQLENNHQPTPTTVSQTAAFTGQEDVQMADATQESVEATNSNNSQDPKEGIPAPVSSLASTSVPALSTVTGPAVSLPTPTEKETAAVPLAKAAHSATSGLAASVPSVPVPPQSMESTPSMESIVKVAEAAVAAQNAAAKAAAAAKANSSTPSQTNGNVDPNLDPSLFSDSNHAKSNDKDGAAKKGPMVSINTSNENATASGSKSTATPNSATPVSSLSNNPYFSLSTAMLPRQNPGSTTPNGHPMMMHPYPIFYPPPGTPVTPNSPGYPMPYGNPYYYLAAPMMPGPNGMYAPVPPGFPPIPGQQQQPVQQQQQQQGPPADSQPRPAKPKRLKAHTVTTKSFSIPMVPRDKKGKPMLPLNVGIMTVINLGEVCMREHFHTERYIFPVGYEVTRRYLSTMDPTIEVVYHCTILDGGDGPKFQIIPSDKPDKPVIAGTATGAWSNIVKQANAIRNRQHSNSVSGPDFFGLGQNTIKHLIQELPNSDRLRDYVWQNFVEGGPLGGRHAAVIPALPEEYDASMPIGAYYPKRDVSANPSVPRGMSHYPQHIIAQAEAQKAQKLAAQFAKEQGVTLHQSGPNSEQEGSSSNGAPQGSSQINIPNSSEGIHIEEYQPIQGQHPAASISTGKRATRSSTNAHASTSSTSGRNTRASARGNQQQQQQAQQQMSASASPSMGPADTSSPMATTLAGIMNQFPAPAAIGLDAQNPAAGSIG